MNNSDNLNVKFKNTLKQIMHREMLIVLTYAWFKSKIFKLGISELLGEEEF